MIKIAHGVDITRFDPGMKPVFAVVPEAFMRFGYDCWLTSGFREGDSKLHGEGKAADFDSSKNIPEQTGYEIRDWIKTRVGPDFDIVWHASPNWHMHTELDPE